MPAFENELMNWRSSALSLLQTIRRIVILSMIFTVCLFTIDAIQRHYFTDSDENMEQISKAYYHDSSMFQDNSYEQFTIKMLRQCAWDTVMPLRYALERLHKGLLMGRVVDPARVFDTMQARHLQLIHSGSLLQLV